MLIHHTCLQMLLQGGYIPLLGVACGGFARGYGEEAAAGGSVAPA